MAGVVVVSALSVGAYFFYNKNIIEKSVINNDGEYVVLLHGLGRTSFSMNKLGKQLAVNGYRVINIDYPSKSDSVENLVENFFKKELAEKYIDQDEKINFVTHSMGGIMVRYFLSNNDLENVGRVVMLAPPNKGSESADFWSNNKIGGYVMGPALDDLTTDENSFVNMLLELDCEVGVVAGEYDGKVDVERTKLDEMTDFCVVPNFHTWIMNDDKVIDVIINFLSKGKF